MTRDLTKPTHLTRVSGRWGRVPAGVTRERAGSRTLTDRQGAHSAHMATLSPVGGCLK